MRLQTLTLILGLLIYGQVSAQLILTDEENLAWINKLRNENELSTRLAIVRARILADTGVYVKNNGDRLILRKGGNENKQDGLCRPILIVEGHLLQVTNNTDKQTIERLSGELTIQNIKQLEVLDGEKAKALFGQNGWSGFA
ncbi:MAG: hypothetical protein RIE86_06440 [Imperialibacter sp.]|uniref:hypothetical protein n=1 Tax=Imperialibacter sp. TaxID=2038411 RepID=UPI0032ED51DD